MTPQERIARLQALLDRVKERQSEARPSGEEEAELAAASVTTDQYPDDDGTSLDDYDVEEVVELDADEEDDSIHPPAFSAPPSMRKPEAEGAELESRSRLVSAIPGGLTWDDDDSEPTSIPLVQRRPSQIPPESLEAKGAEEAKPPRRSLPPEVLEELELVEDEPAPSSSPRPIAQALTELDFEEERPIPRVTPPPESGKQVSTQDNDPFDDFGGVHGANVIALEAPLDDAPIALQPLAALPSSPPAISPMEMELPVAQSPGQFIPREDYAPPPRQLVPEMVRPDLPATKGIAVLQGEAPTFRPATFGELLSAALRL